MATGTEVKHSLEFVRLVKRMLADEDLKGDALLLALSAAEMAYFPEDHRRNRTWQAAADRAFEVLSGRRWVLRSVIRNDIPRYEFITSSTRWECVAPMIRREGLCGGRATHSWGDRDPDTGEGRMVGLCTRHARSEFGQQLRREREYRRRQWHANGEPTPPANTGGVLARYFDTDWTKLYEWADPHRAKNALPGGKPKTEPRPTLTLIRGENS